MTTSRKSIQWALAAICVLSPTVLCVLFALLDRFGLVEGFPVCEPLALFYLAVPTALALSARAVLAASIPPRGKVVILALAWSAIIGQLALFWLLGLADTVPARIEVI